MRKSFRRILFIAAFAFIFFAAASRSAYAGAFTIKASAKTVKVGHTITMSARDAISWSVSDKTIASISKDGVLTGKKPGKVVVSAKSSNGKKASIEITVKKSSRKPNLPLTFDEINVSEGSITIGDPQAESSTTDAVGISTKWAYAFSASVTDDSSKASIKKLVCTYEISYTYTDGDGNSVLAKDELKVIANNIKPKKSAVMSTTGVVGAQSANIRLKKMELYSGDALYIYDADKDAYTLEWGTKDTVKPKLSGLLKKKSICNGEPYLICYSDRRSQFDFKKFVKATDDRDGRIKVKADTSGIDFSKSGTYKVKYTATDSSGNTATSWAKVKVIVPGTAEDAADDVLSSIIKKNWSDKKKAWAIYKWVRGHLSYSEAAHTDWRTAGLNGIRYGVGDCVTYWGTSRLLLTRAGIPNVTINRYPSHKGYEHYWNLVYIQGGWYHFDTTPRPSKNVYFLLTDSQMHAKEPGNTFAFNSSLYPARATKVISD